MKTTPRFDRTFEKLYNAFNNGTLDAMDCSMCAVGNMCDGNEDWTDAVDGKALLNHHLILKTGYLASELKNIENLFMFGSLEGRRLWDACRMTLQDQFNGLIAVLNYLAELDGIESIETQYNRFQEVLERETINAL